MKLDGCFTSGSEVWYRWMIRRWWEGDRYTVGGPDLDMKMEEFSEHVSYLSVPRCSA